jgi:hypothetical protein
MTDQVLWRKIARIAIMLAERLGIAQERALGTFYNTRTFSLLKNPDSGLNLLSDEYIVNDTIRELENM